MNEPLTRAGRDLLAEMTAYHTSRILAFERERIRTKEPNLKLSRAILDLSTGSVHGEDREALQECARRAGVEHFDPQKPVIPFSELAGYETRDLSRTIAAGGAYLISPETQAARDIMRAASIMRAGVEVEAGLVGDQIIPKTTVKSTAMYLTTETTQVTPSQATIASIAMTPKMLGGVINFSRQLSKQANAEAFVRRELNNTVRTVMEQGVLNGTGASGQPTGLFNTAGIGSQSGTSLSHAGASNMKETVASQNANDADISFIGTPAVREILEVRERAVGLGFVWDKDLIASVPGYATTSIPAAGLVCGAWPEIYVGIWGGITIEINPHDPTHFKTGVIQARLLLAFDVAVRQPSAFVVATTVT